MAFRGSYVLNKILGTVDESYIACIPWISAAQDCAKHSGCSVFPDYPIVTAQKHTKPQSKKKKGYVFLLHLKNFF